MKTFLSIRLAFGLLLLLSSLRGGAQTQPVAALPGYWSLGVNPTTRDHTIIRFYNGQNQVVYEEALPQLLDLNRVPPSARALITDHLSWALQWVLRNPASASQNGSVLSPDFAPKQFALRRFVPRQFALRQFALRGTQANQAVR